MGYGGTQQSAADGPDGDAASNEDGTADAEDKETEPTETDREYETEPVAEPDEAQTLAVTASEEMAFTPVIPTIRPECEVVLRSEPINDADGDRAVNWASKVPYRLVTQ